MLQELTGISCPDIVIMMLIDGEDEPVIYHKKRKTYMEETIRVFTAFRP
jgi:hypothetical protein